MADEFYNYGPKDPQQNKSHGANHYLLLLFSSRQASGTDQDATCKKVRPSVAMKQ